ncbi:hypothetical protein C8R44DRAFT_370256 [Mycena epipterygia]|nr:hypothetical protein C8R44DRAFT_370256 [Mycena epipterygia]
MPDQFKTRHLLLVPIPAYGHIRPLCVLATRLVAEVDVIVTLLIAPNWLKQTRLDVSSQFPSGHEAVERIRVVSLFESTETEAFALIAPTGQHYPAAYETLFRGNAIKCATRGTVFAAVPPPTVVVLDMFAIEQLHATRAISGTSVPIFTLISCNAGAFLRWCGPASMGGLGDLVEQIDAEVLRTGETPDEIAEKIINETNGSVVNMPGMPAMYDYEAFPQKLPFKVPAGMITFGGYGVVRGCDGIFIGAAPAYDGASLAALEDWVTHTLHKDIYAVGPLLLPDSGAPVSIAPRDTEMKAFLDRMQSKFGENSVLFISFGTVFWPTVPEQLEVLVDALSEKKFPFILSHPSPFASISDSLSEKITGSGIGFATAWCPQQMILNHPATGWFLTHGGHGGIIESLSSGVPMICWPFHADQPMISLHLSQNLNVAFHLIEVRTGKGLQPLHSGRVPRGTREAVRAEIQEVLDECRGEVGREKRGNAYRMRGEIKKAWEEGGSAQVALHAFLTKY